MIVLSNMAAQTLQPGQAITFDELKLKAGCGECYNRQLPQSVKLQAKCGVYSLGFSGTVTSDTAGNELQLHIAIGGQPLSETVMHSTPATANALNNVSTETRFQIGCSDLSRVSVINTGVNPITIPAGSTSFVIDRRG